MVAGAGDRAGEPLCLVHNDLAKRGGRGLDEEDREGGGARRLRGGRTRPRGLQRRPRHCSQELPPLHRQPRHRDALLLKGSASLIDEYMDNKDCKSECLPL